MFKKHIKKVGSNLTSQVDSISLGQQVIVEDLSDELGEKSASNQKLVQSNIQNVTKVINNFFSFDWSLRVLLVSFSILASGFVLYSITNGLIGETKLALMPMGKEVGLALGFFLIINFIAIPLLLSKRKVKLFLQNDFLHIKSFSALNQKIPVNQIKGCKINIFKKDENVGILELKKGSQNHYTVDLESGILVSLTNGQNLLISSSNSYPSIKNLIYS